MSDDDLLAWQRWREGELPEDQRQALLDRLQGDGDLRRRCRDDLRMEQLLTRAHADDDGFVDECLLLLDERLARRRSPWGALPIAASIAAAAALVACVLLLLPPTGDDPAFAADAPLSLADGSRMLPAADLRWQPPASGRPAELVSGILLVEAQPRSADDPLRVATAHLIGSVVGTRFTVAARAEHAVLTVSEGRVAVEHPGTTERVLLDPDHFAWAGTEQALEVRVLDRRRVRAVDDFAFGLPRAGSGYDRWWGSWRPIADGCLVLEADPDHPGRGLMVSAAGGWEEPPILEGDDCWLLTCRVARDCSVAVSLVVADAAGGETRLDCELPIAAGDDFDELLLPLPVLARPTAAGPMQLLRWELRADLDSGLELRRCAWVASTDLR